MTEAKAATTAKLEAPRFHDGEGKLVAGLRRHYTGQTMHNLPMQWQRFRPYIGNLPGQVGRDTYGLCFGASNPDGVEYLTGVEVTNTAGLPDEFSVAPIPKQAYAVFVHRGHILELRNTLNLISRNWQPEWGKPPIRTAIETPDFFERYTNTFDPESGLGTVEIWVPVVES